MSNFAFLHNQWPEIEAAARQVEAYLQTDPRSACFYARHTLALTVQWLFKHDPAFSHPYDTTLAALLHEASFRANVPPPIYTKAQLIRKQGKLALHSRAAISQQTALGVAIDLYHLLYWLARTYTRDDPTTIPDHFAEERLLPLAQGKAAQSQAQLNHLADALLEKDKAMQAQATTLAESAGEVTPLKAQVARQKAINQAWPDTHNYSEAETRRRIIDVMLREAGWDPAGPNVPEYEVQGMPFGRKTGYVDYVLWGDDGLPLALVEAKRTSADPIRGKEQANLYADCLAKMHGQRPLIFYTNGYNTYLWDDERYPPRLVQGFYTKNQLMRLIQRRSTAQPLAHMVIKQTIVDRYYQVAAIRHLTEHFSAAQRKGLVVMATGSGKTRVAVALVDLLQRANWVKRVLFLADRSALVQQAVGAFKTHLPASKPVNLLERDGKAEAPAARVVVSTYHTMLNLIDEGQADGQPMVSVGHFDLIIIDEAHRSIYQKFGAIFAYFDSLLLGLTATPKDEIDRNTYHMFDLEDGVPTYAYDLEEAVADGYLVPYRAVETPTQFIRDGIKYDDLSEAEQAEWERLDWGDSTDIPETVNATAINSWLFNTDTVDLVLKTVMAHGLNVAGGDRLGKTIIFAKNHDHADFIAKRFDHHYPEYRGHFARVIDHTINYAQSVIDKFSEPANLPHIAISVDMLDTGIDVPPVVNLVFFKVVRSKTKFWQMIGRGTRLCPDLFGPGQDKTHFLIFDPCLNFAYFNQNPTGATPHQSEPLSQTLFKDRLSLLKQLRQLLKGDPSLKPLVKRLTDTLHSYVAAMNTANFIVRPQRKYVDPFQARARWETLSPGDAAQLARYVSGLPTAQPQADELTKRFDLLVVNLQLAYLAKETRFNGLRDKIINLATNLADKTTITKIEAELPFIERVQTETFWLEITLPLMAEIGQRLRDLVPLVDKKARQAVYTTFKDTHLEAREVTGSTYYPSGVNMAQYKKKVAQFIRAHEDYVAIQKIHWGIPLTAQDLADLTQFFYQAEAVGGKAQFVAVYGEQASLAVFIRSLVGLNREKAKERFAQFLDGQTCTADQIRFVNYIIDHLAQNGTIDPELLYNQPYTDINYKGLNGLFSPAQANALLAVVAAVNEVVAG